MEEIITRPHFVRTDVLVDLFLGGPRIDYERFRADLDSGVDQDLR